MSRISAHKSVSLYKPEDTIWTIQPLQALEMRDVRSRRENNYTVPESF
jgi:hypothetical protein